MATPLATNSPDSLDSLLTMAKTLTTGSEFRDEIVG